MKPYYSEGGITIYHGDCREVLGRCECSVIIADPPYGTAAYETDVAVITTEMLSEWVDRYRAVAIFGWPEALAALCGGRTPSEWITWWPTNGAIRGFHPTGLWRESEHVAVFGDACWRDARVERSVSARRSMEVAERHGRVDFKNARGVSNGDPDTRRAPDVWRDAAPGLGFQRSARRHPNEKPVSVLSRLVTALARHDDVICDPFMGSGTALVAAQRLCRRAIGIEIEERFCEVAAKRLQQGALPLEVA